METKRKKEEELRRKQEEVDRKTAVSNTIYDTIIPLWSGLIGRSL